MDAINLTIEHGKTTAIVGSSGSGKTTLLKIILKLYEPSEGKIFIGTINSKNISKYQWREQCGVVMQDNYIFSDSILNNITLKNYEALDIDRLVAAANSANIKDWIESLPLQYQTKIGSEGVGLSQGQKQRLLIARALYKNPTHIFFDEATNSLDTENESIIMKNLADATKNKTVLVIAHRLSTVKNADVIVVLFNGKIVEKGNHNQLLKMKSYYYNLVNNQLS